MSVSAVFGTLSIIPPDIVLLCLRELSPLDLRAVSLACRRFRFLAQDSLLWVHLCQRDFRLNPPEPMSARRIYQIHSDMRQERYIFSRISKKDPIALIGKKIRVQDCFYDAHNQDVKNLSLPGPLTNLMTGSWNGTQLASKEERPSRFIDLWQEEKGHLNPYEDIEASPKERFIRYQWHGKQLVTISGDINSITNSTFFEIWDVSQVPTSRERIALPYNVSQFLSQEKVDYGVFAWDDNYLAVAGKEDLYVGQMKEGSMKGISYSEIDNECCVTSLKWQGKFLFVGDRTGEVMIYDRVTGVLHCMDLSLPEERLEITEDDWYFFEFLFQGDLIFITTNVNYYSELTLWQQSENGSIHQLYSFENCIFKETDSNTSIQCGMRDDSLVVVNDDHITTIQFGLSYEEIYRDIAERLKKAVEMKNGNSAVGQDKIRNVIKLAYQRLSNMPRRQVDSIEQEVKFIAGANENDPSRKDEYTYRGILSFLTPTKPSPAKKGRWSLKS
jgi:hypothetical protein